MYVCFPSSLSHCTELGLDGSSWNFHWSFPPCPYKVSSGELDPIRIRATPIRKPTILPIQTNPMTIFEIFSARWTPNTMLTMYKQFWTFYDFRIHRIGSRIGSETIARTICRRFSNCFQPDGHRMRRWPRTSSLNTLRFPDPPNRVRLDRQNHLLTIFNLFSFRWTPMRCWPCRNGFEHYSICGSTESAVEPVSNRRSGQSTNRGFNLSAFYALVPLVSVLFNLCRVDPDHVTTDNDHKNLDMSKNDLI